MTGPVRAATLGGACLVLLSGCGSNPAPSRVTTATGTVGATTAVSAAPTAGTPSASPPTATPTGALPPTRGAPTAAALAAIYAQLHPASSGGGDCVTGATAPVWTACPLTARLVAALDAAVAHQTGPGADPLCGCQALDPNATATYTLGSPTGGGRIHVSGFDSPLVTYVVIPSGGRLLVDDVIYCSPSVRSIYAGEAGATC